MPRRAARREDGVLRDRERVREPCDAVEHRRIDPLRGLGRQLRGLGEALLDHREARDSRGRHRARRALLASGHVGEAARGALARREPAGHVVGAGLPGGALDEELGGQPVPGLRREQVVERLQVDLRRHVHSAPGRRVQPEQRVLRVGEIDRAFGCADGVARIAPPASPWRRTSPSGSGPVPRPAPRPARGTGTASSGA